jgi:glutamate racemase
MISLLPSERYIYLGDTARVPYGGKSVETIRQFAKQLTEFLVRNDVKMVVAACNTVSALALDIVAQTANMPCIGTIEPAVIAATKATKNHKIGVIGTVATIASKAYQDRLAELQPNTEVHATACPLFVPLAEEGWFAHPATYMIAEEYLASLRTQNTDTLILGCTHYPMLSDVIADVMPEAKLINSGEEVAKVAQTILQNEGLMAPVNFLPPNIHCYITDKPALFTSIAERFLGFPILNVQLISL